MKKPTRPTKPRMPSEPQKVYGDTRPYECYPSDLQQLMNELTEAANRYEEFPHCTRRSNGLIVPADHVVFHTDYDGGFSVKWNQPVKITLSDEEFAARQAKYQKALDKYRSKMVDYEMCLAKYETDLEKYLVEQRALTEERERKMLNDLKKKYKE